MKNLTKEDLLNRDNYCLLLTVDDHNSLNNKRLEKTNEFESRNYIDESVRCIKSWRKKGGFLKDIKIIVDYVGKTELPIEVLEFYGRNDITLHYSDYSKYQELFEYGFVNVHLSGWLLDELDLLNPIIIHTDLDMELLQPLTLDTIEPILTKECIIGGYREEDLINQRPPLYNTPILNSDFIITKNKHYRSCEDSIYKMFYQDIEFINYYYDCIKQEMETTLNKKLRDFDIEEYGVDKTLAENYELFHVIKEDSYEQGEGYHQIENIDLNKVFFWHEHILSKPNEYFLKQKIKLITAIKQHNGN